MQCGGVAGSDVWTTLVESHFGRRPDRMHHMCEEFLILSVQCLKASSEFFLREVMLLYLVTFCYEDSSSSAKAQARRKPWSANKRRNFALPEATPLLPLPLLGCSDHALSADDAHTLSRAPWNWTFWFPCPRHSYFRSTAEYPIKIRYFELAYNLYSETWGPELIIWDGFWRLQLCNLLLVLGCFGPGRPDSRIRRQLWDELGWVWFCISSTLQSSLLPGIT